MAKKNTNDPNAPASPKRAAGRRPAKSGSAPAAAPIDISSVTATEPIDTASDMGGKRADTSGKESSANQPSADEIAQAAYQRYLSRGGEHGRDFEDWIEAERELANRNTRR